MSRVDDLVDGALEALVAPSFTKVGYEVRRRLDGWTPLGGYDLRGRTYVVTGATSGLGLAAADALVSVSAHEGLSLAHLEALVWTEELLGGTVV